MARVKTSMNVPGRERMKQFNQLDAEERCLTARARMLNYIGYSIIAMCLMLAVLFSAIIVKARMSVDPCDKPGPRVECVK